MSLLLCKKEAETPFYSEKLDIRLWSMQELCYVIYNHPLLAAGDLAGEELCKWLREELAQGFLAARIEQIRAAAKAEDRDPSDEILMAILRDCNYYSPAEIDACQRRLSAYQNCPPEDRAHAEGVSLFKLRRYRMAEEHFREEAELLSERAGKAQPGREREAVQKRRANVCCDLAVIKARLFENEAARKLLSDADKLSESGRAARLRYYLRDAEDSAVGNDADGLTDEERSELDRRREEVRMHVLSGRRLKELNAMFEQDPVKREAACAEQLRKWKKEYRRMK